jgi:poly(A) polymerase
MGRKAEPGIARAAAMGIVRTLRGAGHVAFFAGGCVRDELLGLKPTDYDVATDATPERIKGLFRRTNEVGAAFGVVLVTLGPDEGLPERATVEVATFRSEGPYSDRRRPDSVTYSDPRADALRRDFTINALFLDPEGDGPLPSMLQAVATIPHPVPGMGRVIDLVGGVADLRARVLRAVGDPEQRLAEDHLRALRAVRLAARLGFAIDPGTSDAIRRHARDLEGLSRERIGDEMRRMMSHPSRGRAIESLQQLELDAPVLTEPHLENEPRVLSSLGEASQPGFGVCLAAWALDRGFAPEAVANKDLVARWRPALCLSNEESESLSDTLGAYAVLREAWLAGGVAMQKRAIRPGFFEGLVLLQATHPAAASQIAARVEDLRQSASGLHPTPVLNGDDLVAAGFSPGPAFKILLDRVYDAQLEGRIKTTQEGMELARTLAHQTG